MCELLGLNANIPTDICFSFRGFAARGGKTGDHTDGWGIAFYTEQVPQIVRDTTPCADSTLAESFKHESIRSTNIISHVRKATQGYIKLENCHPFSRELNGLNWTFAHNGDLQEFYPRLAQPWQTRGDTDSERAFCAILQHFAENGVCRASNIDQITELLIELVAQIKDYGAINFLLSDGRDMWAFCSSILYSITRKYPFGFSQLIDEDHVIDFREVTTSQDIVTVIATRPLTCNESWDEFSQNELRVFQQGLIHFSTRVGDEAREN
jgi:predicted glutamine amidotransferase